MLHEVNFDGLVGPTHHFGGLGVGNLASQSHLGQIARPRAAALQGIEKIRRCVALGGRQAFLPPQHRPSLTMLRRMGFQGTRTQLLASASKSDPYLLSAVWSASAMWAANAATVSPGTACQDGITHLTVANLSSSLHRSIEPAQTLRLLREVFHQPSFKVHRALPASVPMRDEGAANHMRITDPSGIHGVDVFVYGDFRQVSSGSSRLFPRQGLEASRGIARMHGLDPQNVFFLRQHPEAIDAGAFHNDVVATSHQHVWLHHEMAYVDADETIAAIEKRFQALTSRPLIRVETKSSQLSLSETVACYLFNGQLISRPDDRSMTLLCPNQVAENANAMAAADAIRERVDEIVALEFVELRESMNNGGGPACLRLRVPMTASQWDTLPANIKWSPSIADDLCESIEQHYPETLTINDLVQPELIEVSRQAVAAIEKILGLSTRWKMESAEMA